jgi:predicted anti-sigma-YlaC factor YlaD
MRTLSSRHDACLQARERASLRLDGELSAFEATALRTHLHGCADCRTYVAGIEATSRTLRATPLEEPNLSIRVPRRSFRSLVAVGPAVAAAAVAAVAVMQVTSPGAPGVSVGPARTGSDASALRADYTDRRLSRLFINGFATRPGHVSTRLPASPVQTD